MCLTIKIGKKTYKKIKEMADKQRRTIKAVVDIAIEQYDKKSKGDKLGL